MKITIAGSGAMGCRFGAALFEAGHEVLLLDGWAGHVAAINEAGLAVTDETGTRAVPVPAALFPAAANPANLVIVFAKATATAAVAAAAAATIGPSSLLLTLQNGLGNVEELGAHASADRLLAGWYRRSAAMTGSTRWPRASSMRSRLSPGPRAWRWTRRQRCA